MPNFMGQSSCRPACPQFAPMQWRGGTRFRCLAGCGTASTGWGAPLQWRVFCLTMIAPLEWRAPSQEFPTSRDAANFVTIGHRRAAVAARIVVGPRPKEDVMRLLAALLLL